MVTEAILKHTNVRSIGLCNAPIGLIKRTAAKYGVATDRVYAEFVGLNHLHWVTRVDVNGEDKLDELLADTMRLQRKQRPGKGMESRVSPVAARPAFLLFEILLHDGRHARRAAGILP